MQVSVIPLTEFVHGSITAHQGRPQMMDKYVAEELERAGLVRIKMTPTPGVKDDAGKAQDDGLARLSSASPVGQVLQPTTLHVPARGPGRPRKTT